MTDLTEILETVAKTYWGRRKGKYDAEWEHLSPDFKAKFKGEMLPIVHQVTELVEAAVKFDLSARIWTRQEQSVEDVVEEFLA